MRCINDFVPMLGDEFTILTAASVTGQFEEQACSSVLGVLDLTYEPNAVILTITAEPVFADLNCDGAVDEVDFNILLDVWGPCPDPPTPCPADLNGNGSVGIVDFLLLVCQLDRRFPVARLRTSRNL